MTAKRTSGRRKKGAAKAPRRTKRTDPLAKKKGAFLETLGEQGIVLHACRAAGVGRSTVYEWREKDEAFARAWNDAVEDVADDLEASALERAKAGDTILTIFLLKAMRPEKYRETKRWELTGEDGTPMKFTLDIPRPGR